jgi:hypothetical protein
MENIYKQLGDYYFRRAYRMTYDTFCKLNNLLQGTIARLAKKPGSNPAINRNAPNGRIDPAIRLGIAIRYFAGASVYDIMTTFGIWTSGRIQEHMVGHRSNQQVRLSGYKVPKGTQQAV